MFDLFLFFSVLIVVGAMIAANIYYKTKTECKHDYGNWVQQETEHAYVQMRVCSKCNYAYVHQFRKMGSSDGQRNESSNS